MSRAPKLHAVDDLTPAPRPVFTDDRKQLTVKYPGQLVLGRLASDPTMIVRQGGKLEVWDGREGLDFPPHRRG